MRFIESETVEYKESLIQLKKGVISIVSILNKHKKGRIIFGIQDDGTVKGVSVGKNTLREISKSISDNIEPKIYPEIKEDLIEGKQCVVIDFLGKNIPYFAFGRAYVRTADEDRLLSSKELEELILKKNKYNLKWDEDICLNANLSDISSKKLKEYVLKAGLKYISKKETLENLELMKVDKLTNASIILLKISTEILLGFNTQKSFVISGTRNVPFLCTPTFRLRFLIQRNVFAFLEPATLLLCSKNSTFKIVERNTLTFRSGIADYRRIFVIW